MTRHLFLSGPMGSGKSTVGRLVAERLGWPFVDLDRAIEERAGRSTSEIFRDHGEAAFRTMERELARGTAALEAPHVCALGGGTVVDADTRRVLAQAGTIVTLTAPVDELLRRVDGETGRPLLDRRGTTRREVLEGLLAARASAYAEAHAVIDTRDASPEQLAERVIAAVREEPILVPLGTASYRARVTTGLDALESLVSAIGPSSVVLVTDENAAVHATRARTKLGALPVVDVVLPPGEAHKTIASVERIWDTALAARVDRDALVLAVGGGVVGDVAGFAAATLLRGTAVAHVPTTLLAMVDSAIGGKTGIDHAEGKNLVGAFHQPRFVLADLTSLATLPDRELASGLGEVVKSAWIAGEAEVAMLERDAPALCLRDPAALARAIRMSLRLKASIVAADPHERGVRAHLNLGHTVGHALETASGYALRHGEAVALGLVAALRLGRALGDARTEDVERMVALLAALGLPTDLEARFDPAAARYLAADKKRASGRIRFVVPGAPGIVRLEPLDPAVIRGLVLGNLAAAPA
jgi:shikimate kinase/3-dehydroquinate synthase